MNNSRRKELKEAQAKIVEAMEIIDLVKEEEQDAFDNLPENFQYGEKGENMEAHIDELDELFSELEDLDSRLDTVINNELV